MKATKQNIYRVRRVVKEILQLRKTFYNWDEIIKRSVNGKSTKILQLRDGVRFYNSSHNTLSICKEIFVNKVYSNEEVKIEEGDIVFDIGANVGVFSLFASLVKETQVYAFEPHPKNYGILINNVSQNEIETIRCFNYALGLKEEERLLIEGSIAGGHKLSYNDKPTNSEETLKVTSVTLKSMMEQLNVDSIDFIKLDCEGAEGEVIKSLGQEGLKRIKKMAIEFHDNHSLLSHKEILNELQNSGFKTSLKWDGKSYFGYIYANR